MMRKRSGETRPAKEKGVLLLSALELGGAERQALQLAEYMQKKYDMRFEVWGLHTPGYLCRMCDEKGIGWRILDVHGAKGLRRWIRILKFSRLLRHEKVSLLLPFTSVPNVYACLAAKLGGVKLCVWNQRDEGKDLKRKWRYRLAVHSASVICTNSVGGADALNLLYGVSRSKCHLTPNGVRIPRPTVGRDTYLNALGIPPNRPVACMIANISRNKDHKALIRAWRVVVDNRQAALLLAGRKDDAYESCKRLATDLGLNESVFFLGFLQDPDSLLYSSDICVFSSRSEGCPNGVLEGMAAGLPVIASDLPSVKSVVSEENLKYLATPGDTNDFADKILSALAHPGESATAGKCNKAKVLREHQVERACDRYSAVLEKYSNLSSRSD
jgi:glycosyltransferase involved in cell wall biosynthesis